MTKAGFLRQSSVVCLVAVMLIQSLVVPCWALSGWEVVAGEVTFEESGDVFNVTSSSNNAIVQWQTFNVGEGQTVNFILPNSTASILNRILNGPSAIAGAINSNGIVLLSNPSGIHLATTANVNTAGFVASTLNLSNENYLNNAWTFERDEGSFPGAVLNEGRITTSPGGFVVLNGAVVQNHGNIFSPDGTVSLAVGDRITVDLGATAVEVTVNEALRDSILALEGLVGNTGRIEASVIDLQAHIRDNLFGLTVNNDGILKATHTTLENGRISLYAESGDQTTIVRNSGTMDASNAEGSGGTIQLLGDNVLLESGSLLDASGQSGGGEILVGGDYQGQGDIRTANLTMVSPGAQLNADALQNGNGGKVIVWSDGETYYYGNISAKGGSHSGDGGFVEVSGKQYLDFWGDVDTTAANGQKGTLLLDPDNITILSFDPASLNPSLWVDSNQSSSLVLNGSNVSQWRDLSGNGNHLNQATPANQPTLVSDGLNGKDIITNAFGDLMVSTAKVTPKTFVFVTKVNAPGQLGAWRYIADFRGGSPGIGSSWVSGKGFGGIWNGLYVNSSSVAVTPANLFTGNWQINIMTSSTASLGLLNLFSRYSNNETAVGDIATVMTFGNTLTAAQRSLLEQNLSGEWGIALSTPLSNYSTLVENYLEHLSQTTNIALQANQNITIQDLADNTLDLGSHGFSLEATNGSITFVDPNDTIRTNGGLITFTAGQNITGVNYDTTGGGSGSANVALNASGTIDYNTLNLNGGKLILNGVEICVSNCSPAPTATPLPDARTVIVNNNTDQPRNTTQESYSETRTKTASSDSVIVAKPNTAQTPQDPSSMVDTSAIRDLPVNSDGVTPAKNVQQTEEKTRLTAEPVKEPLKKSSKTSTVSSPSS